MLNHPVSSVIQGALWRQESLLAEAANDQPTDFTRAGVRCGLVIAGVVLVFFGSRGR